MKITNFKMDYENFFLIQGADIIIASFGNEGYIVFIQTNQVVSPSDLCLTVDTEYQRVIRSFWRVSIRWRKAKPQNRKYFKIKSFIVIHIDIIHSFFKFVKQNL